MFVYVFLRVGGMKFEDRSRIIHTETYTHTAQICT